MIVASLLVITGLISSARGSPMSYATYRRREMPVDERPELLLLYDQRGLENTDPPLRSANDIDHADLDLRDDSTMSRSKKLRMSRTSLSIVNPLDVLRDRVMLELARRKAMQDQRQIDANRRILEEIGKRSAPAVIDRSYAPRSSIYDRQSEMNQENNNQMHHTQRIPVDFYNVDENVIRSSSSSSSSSNNGEDETRKESNYHHDRI